MEIDTVDRYMRWARHRIGIRPEVRAETVSGVPCKCCGVKLRPLYLQAVAQVLAQRIFLLHLVECDWCEAFGFMSCDVGLGLFRGLPPEYQRTVLGVPL